MNFWIDSINNLSAAWSAWLWRAIWQAAIVVCVAWLLAYCLRNSSPQLRSWIWRLAYVKLLLLLVWITPVTLAALPAPEDSGAAVQSSRRSAAEIDNDAVASDATQASSVAPQSRVSAPPEMLPAAVPSATSLLTPSPAHPFTPSFSLASWILSAWALGFVAMLIWLSIDVSKAIRLYRSVQFIERPELALLIDEVRERLGLHCKMRVGESPIARGPLLIKFRTSIVVFPAGAIAGLEGSEIRLVLAHELAHVKRRDLAWNAVAAIVHSVLYFHPLLWLAQHWFRQEQEMSCDEIAVTGLNACAQTYGKMLLKVVQQSNPMFSTGLATADMSGSYLTLSRRIEAMKHIRKFTHKQIVMAGFALAVLGCIAVIPWRVVAQDAKPSDGPQVRGSGNTKATEAKQVSAPDKLIVGAWRGVLANVEGNNQDECEVIFRGDFTYQDYSRRFFPSNVLGSPAPQMAYDRGHWQIKGKELILSAELPAIPFLKGLTPASQAPPDETTDAAQRPLRTFTIVLLNDSLLRLQTPRTENDAAFGTGGGPGSPAGPPLAAQGDLTLFYRRENEVPAVQKYDASITAPLRDLAEKAGLTPAEALELADHIKQLNQKLTKVGGKEINFDWVEIVVAARQGKIDFQKLFGLTDAEATAYAELMKLTNLHFWGAVTLRERGQLTNDEAAAVNKLEAFWNQAVSATTFFAGKTADELSVFINPDSGEVSLRFPELGGPSPNRGWTVSGQTGTPIDSGEFTTQRPQPKQLDVKQKMMGKMQNYISDLQSWLSATVFTQ